MPAGKSSMKSDKALLEKTLANAQRLMRDAKVLASADAAISAVILAIFALEELGKTLILRWGVRNEGNNRSHPSHIEKQGAVFALLSANELLKKGKKKLRKMVEGEGNFLTAGPYSHQFAWARSGFYNDLRMAATYADEDPKIPDELRARIGPELAAELIEFYRKGYLAMRNANAMKLAAEIYKNDLGRL